MLRDGMGMVKSEGLLRLMLLALAAESDAGEEGRLRRALWEHHAYLLALLRYKTGSDETAEDLLQETYLSFLRACASPRGASVPRFSDSRKLRNYLTTIALNKVRDHFRGPQSPARRLSFRNAEEADAWLANLPSAEAGHEERLVDEAMARERRNLVALAMEALDERYRRTLELKFAQGLDNPSAAAAMGIGIKALESLLVRAKAAFKKEFLALSAEKPGAANEKGPGDVYSGGGGLGE
jgi:RNA polymerase sigma factor (sigma-70 family)